MSLGESYRINTPNVIQETIDNEAVIINLETGYYYSLDGVGTEIWTLIERNVPLGGIVDRLNRRYQASSADVEGAVTKLIAELRQEKLIVAGDRSQDNAAELHGAAEDTTLQPGASAFGVPTLQKYTDMQDLIMLDPIHEVDDSGWPNRKPAANASRA